MKTVITPILLSALIALVTSHPRKADAIADSPLPPEVCQEFGVRDCLDFTESSVNAQYHDLNGDGTKELVLVYGEGSCGSQYHVFSLSKSLKWVSIGGWCGCDDHIFRVRRTSHNGYRDIETCVTSGFFDGQKYVGRLQ